jgi:Ino eighty subunit 1
MKTALRTYHPVPSMQKTDGNVQDAPRIKNCLKAALLPPEQPDIPGPPNQMHMIISKLVMCSLDSASPSADPSSQQGGQVPPTSVVNLIFNLTNASSVRPSWPSCPSARVNLAADDLATAL